MQFGRSASLCGDGLTLVVGTPGSSNTYEGICNTQNVPNINSNQCASPTVLDHSGAVYYFTSTDGTGTWTQQAYIKPANAGVQRDEQIGDRFGLTVALSSDGNTIAVSAPNEDGTFAGVNYGPGNKDEIIFPIDCINLPPESSHVEDNCATNSGAVYIFGKNTDNTWSQLSYVKDIVAPQQSSLLNFGITLSLSADGETLAVKALDVIAIY